MEIWQFAGRDVVILDTPDGPRAFYRRTGMGDLGKKHPGGAQEDDWAPFEGFLGGDYVKPENLGQGSLRRWGTEQNRQISDWLKSLNLPEGRDVGDAWGTIQRSLEHAGVPVRYPQHGGRPVAPPTPPPEPPRAPETAPPTGPRLPPQPPAAPGGGGAGGPTGVRPLHPVEADFLEGVDPLSSTRHAYDLSIIFDHNSYRARWRTAAGPQGGEPPPQGLCGSQPTADRGLPTAGQRPRRAPHEPDPAARINAARARAPRRAPHGSHRATGPRRPGRPDVTGRAPTGPYPAQAARDLPARPPSPRPRPPAPAPDVARARDLVEPPGRIERSGDRDHYSAREHFGDVIRHGDVENPEARYFVEAEFKDGIIEMDFVLRRDDVPGFEGIHRRSGQLRGQEEFQQVLDHFRGIHGEAAIKGIKGDWGGGDNLNKFNKVINSLPEIDIATDAIRWNKALKSAALETYTGEWARKAGFAEVEIVGYSSHERNNKITFDQVEVIFHKSGAGRSESGGGAGPAPTSEGSPRAASPKTPSPMPAPEFARPAASRTGGGPSSPPPTAQTGRGPPSGPPPSAGPGGGGGGPRRPGVRALTAREAAGVRPEVQLARTRRGDWAISWVMSRDLYEAAWRDATGGQGGPAPPHGFLDRDRNQIVVFKPPINVNVIARRPAPRADAYPALYQTRAAHPALSGAGRSRPASKTAITAAGRLAGHQAPGAAAACGPHADRA